MSHSHDRTERASYWLRDALPIFEPVDSALTVDVAVIGGGVTGLTAAHLCKKSGLSVAVFERDLIAGGDSGNTTAHLTYVTDIPLRELIANFGTDHAVAVWDAGNAALERIHELIHESEIKCSFRHLSAFFHRGEGDLSKDELKKEWQEAVANGFEATFHDQTPLYGDYGIEYHHQALFEPVEYLRGLAKAVHGGRGQVFENSEVTEFSEDPLTLKVNGRKIVCGSVILATHVPLQATQSTITAALFQTKIYPYTSYVIRAKLADDSLPQSSCFDTADPYNYIRIDKVDGGTFAICGGRDDKTGQEDGSPEKRYQELEELLKRKLPVVDVTHQWTGQVIVTADGLPYIGMAKENCYLATGYNGNGYTFGTLAGMIISEQIQGVKNPWRELFDPHRKKLKGAAWNYVQQNLDYPYYMLKDRLSRTEEGTPDSLKPGEGKLLRYKGRRVAAYRPPGREPILLSPVCTHLGCLVHWNNAGSFWDCPCHGSRFKATGEVEGGPAETPLEKLDL